MLVTEFTHIYSHQGIRRSAKTGDQYDYKLVPKPLRQQIAEQRGAGARKRQRD
jgi:hypothetical protein